MRVDNNIGKGEGGVQAEFDLFVPVNPGGYMAAGDSISSDPAFLPSCLPESGDRKTYPRRGSQASELNELHNKPRRKADAVRGNCYWRYLLYPNR